MSRQRFHNQTIIVTGAAGGIGKEIVRLFHKEGANVVLVDLHASAMTTIADELMLEKDRFPSCQQLRRAKAC